MKGRKDPAVLKPSVNGRLEYPDENHEFAAILSAFLHH